MNNYANQVCVDDALYGVTTFVDHDRPRATGAVVEPDPFDLVMNEMTRLNRKKRADYASSNDPFSNFRRSADATGLTPGGVVEVLIAIKDARLHELTEPGRIAQNESVRDTLIDRAVYSVIAVALHDEGGTE